MTAHTGVVTTPSVINARDEDPAHPLRFDLSVPIGRTPEEVFAFLADIQSAEPIPRSAGVRMTKHPSGPTTTGTRWHEEVRLLPGWWMVIESTVTEVDEPRLLGMDFRSAWFSGHLTYTIDATPQGSVLRQREVLRLRRGLGALRRAVDRALRRQLLRRLGEIATLLSSGALATSRNPA